MSEPCVVALKEGQQQCDEDGVFIQVSRQALDESLIYIERLEKESSDLAFLLAVIGTGIMPDEKDFSNRDVYLRALRARNAHRSHDELLEIHRIVMCISECPPRTDQDMHTVGAVKDMAQRVNTQA